MSLGEDFKKFAMRGNVMDKILERRVGTVDGYGCRCYYWRCFW